MSVITEEPVLASGGQIEWEGDQLAVLGGQLIAPLPQLFVYEIRNGGLVGQYPWLYAVCPQTGRSCAVLIIAGTFHALVEHELPYALCKAKYEPDAQFAANKIAGYLLRGHFEG